MGVKHQVYVPPVPAQFDSAFVIPWPSCRHGWVSQTTQPQASVTTTPAHGSAILVMLSRQQVTQKL
jgi:hypothetical protein